jgi:bifunctional DNase/RNase
VVEDLREQTFFATIHLKQGGEPLEIDARPSDAIALALRTGSPVFVAHDVLEKAQVNRSDKDEQQRLKKLLEEIDPDDLGEYEM